MKKTQLAAAIAVIASGALLAAAGTGNLRFDGWSGAAPPGLTAGTTTSSATKSPAHSSTSSSQTAKPGPLVKLEFVAPKYKKDLPLGLMFSSGWPLTIRAVMTPSALGITTDAMPSEFPTIYDNSNGYVILQDPDNCLELPAPYFRGPPGFACSEDPSDETYVGFTPDIDMVGVPDTVGNPDRRAALANSAVSGRPNLNSVVTSYPNGQTVLTTESVPVGTLTGDNVDDGVGYGADDDFTSLVLLSATGTGLVLNADFSPPYVRQQRNLAGFLNTVSYELRDATGSTVITGSMVVPQSLVAPLMQIDDCVGADAGWRCDGNSAFRIDGGAVQTSVNTLQQIYPIEVFNARQYELRAFLVSGVAPSVLVDMNADGVVTAADATLAGYRVISNEETVRFRQYHGDICGGVNFLNVIYADYDGNGRVLSGLVCPGGPGQVSTIPD